MATIKEQDIVLVSKESDGTKVIQMPITRVENVEGGIATVNGVKPDSSKNITISKISNASNADSAAQATKAFQDGNGNIITSTYATKTELGTKLDTSKAFTKATADSLYLGKKDKAASASSADTAAACSGNAATATKATQDASGNVITFTYATKAELTTLATKNELQTGLGTKANTKHTHSISEVTNLQATLDGKALKSHTHAESEITGLSTKLSSKLDVSVFNAYKAEQEGFIDYGDLGNP